MGQGNAPIYNVISIIFVILTVIVLVVVGVSFARPAPVATEVAQVLPTTVGLPTITSTFTPSNTPPPTNTFTPTPTETPTDTPIPPTGSLTPRPTFTPTLTFTPAPTNTDLPTATLTPVNTITPVNTVPPQSTLTFTRIPSLTITATLPFTSTPPPTQTPPPTATTGFTPQPPLADVPSPYPFSLRDGQPVFTQNFANTAGCAWQGVGGQVFDLTDQPLLGVTVHVFGSGVDVRVTSGSNTIYGVSGWEVPLNSNLTGNSYLVEMLSPGGTIISPQVTVTFTANDCARNLSLVNFKQNRPL
jgi:hypothetical protein